MDTLKLKKKFEFEKHFGLQDIPPLEGFVQRIVRSVVDGEQDASNIFSALSEGWIPRDTATVVIQELPVATDVGIRSIKLGEIRIEAIGNHDSILMQMPEEQYRINKELEKDTEFDSFFDLFEILEEDTEPRVPNVVTMKKNFGIYMSIETCVMKHVAQPEDGETDLNKIL